MKLDDLKTLWPLLTAIVVLSGFYYTTQMRLERLEADVAQIEVHIGELEDRNAQLGKSVSKLQKKISNRSKGNIRK